MTTSRIWFLVAIFFMATGTLLAQSHPKELTWALGEFAGEGEWRIRLPQLLGQDWASLDTHQVTATERILLRQRFLDDAVVVLEQQASRLSLDLDKRTLLGTLPTTEPEATQKSLADLKTQVQEAHDGKTKGAEPPESLPLRALWASGRENLPWESSDRAGLATQSKALYLATGSVRPLGGYLSVKVELFSTLENLVLVRWEGSFAPEEAGARMAEVAASFREALIGRPWAGIEVTSAVSGTLIRVGTGWHSLPWVSDDLEPGDLEIVIRTPGKTDETRSIYLEAGKKTLVPLALEAVESPLLVLETEPPGAALYLDSRYLGPSPQAVPRPGATTRIRAQAEGFETLVWEIGPTTASPSLGILREPKPLPSIPEKKDAFYFSLAAFSISLTSTAFLGAWSSEQVLLTNAYALAGNQSGYDQAFARYTWVTAGYGIAGVLTSGLFVWMMFELGNYLDAAQASLP